MPAVLSKARVYSDSTGAYVEIPILVTPDGPLHPLVDYCISRQHDRSISWMKKVVQAVGLFLEYLEANREETEHWHLYQNFAQRLYTGTFDIETGLDPSFLCWDVRNVKLCKDIQFQLTEFFDWLGKSNGSAAKLNPKYSGSFNDSRLDRAAYVYRRNKAFLGHTWAINPPKGAISTPFTRARATPMVNNRQPPEFPDSRFEELLFKGFCVGGKNDYRSMLITLLLHGAGFRKCEPFHLYFCDVHPDISNPEAAHVTIHHPEFGAAPDGWRNNIGRKRSNTRRAYLAEKWAMSPRNLIRDRNAAGWKDPKLDGRYYMRAWWFKPEYGSLFLQIWQQYVHQVANIERMHPFAFVNIYREPKGELYKIDSYMAAHEAAIRRIGLPYGKEHGTTPHGHRHSFAQRLRRSGISEKMIQTFLHHKSPDSQAIYTAPTVNECLLALSQGSERIREKNHRS